LDFVSRSTLMLVNSGTLACINQLLEIQETTVNCDVWDFVIFEKPHVRTFVYRLIKYYVTSRIKEDTTYLLKVLTFPFLWSIIYSWNAGSRRSRRRGNSIVDNHSLSEGLTKGFNTSGQNDSRLQKTYRLVSVAILNLRSRFAHSRWKDLDSIVVINDRPRLVNVTCSLCRLEILLFEWLRDSPSTKLITHLGRTFLGIDQLMDKCHEFLERCRKIS